MERNKILAIIGLVTVTIGIAVAIWFVFFKSDDPDIVTPVKDGPEIGAGLGTAEGERDVVYYDTGEGDVFSIPFSDDVVSTVARGGITRTKELRSSDATDIQLQNSSGGIQFYDIETGIFTRILPDGTVVPLNSTPLPSAQDVAWANGSDSAIVEFPDGANVWYDFKTQEQRTLPSHWTEFDFAPDDGRIAAKTLGISSENRFLVTSNPDGSGGKTVEFLGENAHKVNVSWSPNDQIVAFAHTGAKQGLGKEEVILVGKNNENFPSLEIEGLGFNPNWSPEGDTLLYSTFRAENDLKPELWIVRSDPGSIGESRTPLGITTWADKCTYGTNTTIYCAVPDPNTLPYGIGFQPSLANDTDDSIYKVNLETGATTLIAQPEFDFTIAQMQVSEDESVLYFTDKETGSLQQMFLK